GPMEASDFADNIREAAAEQGVAERASERLRNRAALQIGVLAMLLAITSLGGQNASKEMITATIQASDSYAFYQAKDIRQTSYRLAADDLELRLPTLPPQERAATQTLLDVYRATVARYDSEPDPADPLNPLKGTGKAQLLALAQDWELRRER